MTRTKFPALALISCLGALFGANACEERLQWRCETRSSSECICFVTQNYVVDPNIPDPATEFCDTDVDPGATCCFILDADGDPGSCVCSPDACKSGYTQTKSCQDLDRFL
jgi:hypothetical protein